ncbi:MAG: sigma-54 dependent transcriptional regulator [Terriglobia bacterium]|jgi:DNA-binding NtrC family response regulator|nr:sigma-54 dependent transcriptional regulator [Terriglobia bacterium]
MNAKPPVLLVDDDEGITFSIATYLEAKGYAVTVANSGEEGLRLASAVQFPLVLTDIYIDRVTGLDILKAARQTSSNCAVILMTAKGSVRTTVEAEAGGVFDYLPKPIDLGNLLTVLERAEKSLRIEETHVPDTEPDGELVGISPVMVELYKNIARAARSDATALIRGETGSGKELVARAIHTVSDRAQQPFVPVDCAAIPENLWESELFGATRGAFTSAEKDRAGIIEQARGGTVFLDEIGEIPISFQAKLLRFLEAKEYRAVGATMPKKTAVRILAATHRPLEEMVVRGEFRSDLYHRLNVLNISVPALRERKQDISLLANRFLADANKKQSRNVWLEPEAVRTLERHEWPGNVRELKNAIERMVAMSSPGPLGEADVRQALIPPPAEHATTRSPETLEDAEREHVVEALRLSGGNRTLAAERLGIQRRTLYKKLERWGLAHEGHNGVPETQKPHDEEKD